MNDDKPVIQVEISALNRKGSGRVTLRLTRAEAVTMLTGYLHVDQVRAESYCYTLGHTFAVGNSILNYQFWVKG